MIARRRWAIVLLAVVAVMAMGAGVAVADDGGEAAGPSMGDWLADGHVEACAAAPPDDHSDPPGGTSDTIGWVEGYWYSESLDLDAEAGLDEADVEALTARTAARVEALRCLTFDELPELQFLTRDEYRDRVESSLDGVPDEEWRYEQARLATQLFASHAEDPEAVYTEFQAGFPAAFYNFDEEFMGFIVEDEDDIELSQVTLAHELLHALQDQHWDLHEVIGGETSDESDAGRALVEGGATLLDGTYDDHCTLGEWADECIIPEAGEAPEPAYWGLTLQSLSAYHTPLVAERYEAEGWSAVNALYDDLPTSMVELIYPDRYGTFEAVDPAVPDASDGDWERIGIDGEPYADRIGQHGLTAMLMAPTYETGGMIEIVDMNEFLRAHPGGDVNYDLTATSGWAGDRLYGYENDDGQVGSVWAISWEDTDEADTFADSYVDLLEYRGGEQVTGYANVYDFGGTGGYEMAVAIERAGDELWIVTAPTVDDLEAVHGDIALEETGATPTPIDGTPAPGDPTPSDPTPIGETPTPSVTPTPDSDGIPGLGVTVAVLALVGVSLAIYWRRP